MARSIFSQSNFTAGEFSPRLYSRSDVAKYRNAVKTALNGQVLAHGPFRKRNGTKYVATAKTVVSADLDNTRLIPFTASDGTAYILEVGNLYIRFYTNGAQILSGGIPLELVTTYNNNSIPDLQYAQFGNSLYITHVLFPPRKLVYTSQLVWAMQTLVFSPPPTKELGSGLPTYSLSSAALGPMTVTASSAVFSASDVGRQIIETNAGGTGVAIITAFTDTTHVTATVTAIFASTAARTGYMDLSPLVSITPSGVRVGSVVTLTAAAGAWSGMLVDGIIKYIIIANGVIRFDSFSSPTVASGTVLKTLDSAAATTNWTSEQPTWTANRGYPKCVTFFEQRAWFASTPTQPQSLWSSESGIFDGFGRGDSDDSAIAVDVSSAITNPINWMSSSKVLILGTTEAELTVSATNGPISPTNIQQLPNTYFGSNAQTAVKVAHEILFIQRNLKRIRTFLYDYKIDGYRADDLTFLSEHLLRDTIIRLAYAETPDAQIYAVTATGNLLCAAFVREQDVIGWSKFTTDGLFTEVAKANGSTADEIWVLAERTIGGVLKKYVEVFDNSDGTDPLDSFIDSSLTFSAQTWAHPLPIGIRLQRPVGYTDNTVTLSFATGFPFVLNDRIRFTNITNDFILNGSIGKVTNIVGTTISILMDYPPVQTLTSVVYVLDINVVTISKVAKTFSGINHLEGKTIKVKIDNAEEIDHVVASGAFTTTFEGSQVIAGLPYAFELTTLTMDISGQGTNPQALNFPMRRIGTNVRVYNSVPPNMNGFDHPYRKPADLMNQAVPLFSGVLDYQGTNWGTDGLITLTDTSAFPIEISGITGIVEVNQK